MHIYKKVVYLHIRKNEKTIGQMITLELTEAVKDLRVLGLSQFKIADMLNEVTVQAVNDEGQVFLDYTEFNEWVQNYNNK